MDKSTRDLKTGIVEPKRGLYPFGQFKNCPADKDLFCGKNPSVQLFLPILIAILNFENFPVLNDQNSMFSRLVQKESITVKEILKDNVINLISEYKYLKKVI